jgi:hypothetical protein
MCCKDHLLMLGKFGVDHHKLPIPRFHNENCAKIVFSQVCIFGTLRILCL